MYRDISLYINAIQFAKEENINNTKLIDFLINLDKKLYG